MTIPLTAGITLLSGTMFDYLNPGASKIDINDIATPLSNVCRFAGHLPMFYSVAQHVVNCSYIVPPAFAFDALMHDTAEAFTNDIPTPLKTALPVFKELECKIEAAMAEQFGFEYPLHPAVHLADRQMLGLEMRYIKGDHGEHEVLQGIDFEGLQHMPGVCLTSLAPRVARQLFLDRYEELQP